MIKCRQWNLSGCSLLWKKWWINEQFSEFEDFSTSRFLCVCGGGVSNYESYHIQNLIGWNEKIVCRGELRLKLEILESNPSCHSLMIWLWSTYFTFPFLSCYIFHEDNPFYPRDHPLKHLCKPSQFYKVCLMQQLTSSYTNHPGEFGWQ